MAKKKDEKDVLVVRDETGKEMGLPFEMGTFYQRIRP